jgi:hypothetical protein
MADDYPLTHKLMFLDKYILNYFQNRPPSYNHFDQPKSGSWEEKIKIVTDLPK